MFFEGLQAHPPPNKPLRRRPPPLGSQSCRPPAALCSRTAWSPFLRRAPARPRAVLPADARALTRRPPPRPTEHVPSELWEPFYTDQYAQEHVKPPVTRLLLSAELYCRAWRQALPQLDPPPSPSALLALLARRGTVPALPERPVQEADLRHQPILMVGPAHQPRPSLKAPPTRPGSSPEALLWPLRPCFMAHQEWFFQDPYPAPSQKPHPLTQAHPQSPSYFRPRPHPPNLEVLPPLLPQRRAEPPSLALVSPFSPYLHREPT